MSATNRGSQRVANDAYYTPPKLAETLVSLLPIYGDHTILEPHGGSGAFVEPLCQRNPHVTTFDIDPRVVHTLAREHDVTAVHTDFLEYGANGSFGFDWIIGNPPYQDAMAHVLHAFSLLRPLGSLCFLLRLAFLESKKRYGFWQEHPLHKVWVLSERPSFVGGKTDNCAYGFFWWKRTVEPDQKIEILSWR